jgi:ssrA-binding protein
MNFGNRENKEPTRTRKLLLHKKEILKINSKIKEKKLTLVPISIYMKKNKIKLEIGLAKGKKLYDKREDMAKKDVKRKIERYMKYE